MYKKLGKNLTIVNAIVIAVVVLVGGISIFLSQKILQNGYKIKEMSEHVLTVDSIYTDAFRLVIAMHHCLIGPSEASAKETVSLISKIESEIKRYKANEELDTYNESRREIELLDTISEDIKGLKTLPAVFEEFSKTGRFNKDKLMGLEKYANHIEHVAKEINKIHFSKIAELEKESLKYKWLVLIFFIGFVLIGVFSIYIGHKSITKGVVNPINELVSATMEFSKGTFDKRVHTDSKTEIGLLFESFNKMADKIQEHNEFLRKFGQELEKKVNERTFELQAANAKLRKAHDTIIRAEKIAAIGQVATGVTHEIKTPLNSLSINIQMLLKEVKDKCGTDECRFYNAVNLIQCEVKRINDILNSFVGFAKFPEPKFAQHNINQVISEVAMFISHEAKESGITIDLSLSAKISVFRFDISQIKEVLMNLSQNAINAMPYGGILKITTCMQDNRVVVNVSDTGIGIPEKNKDTIFTPFFSTKDGGLGLGLAIVQRIVEGHEGKINFSSKVGKGSVFEVTLPIERN